MAIPILELKAIHIMVGKQQIQNLDHNWFEWNRNCIEWNKRCFKSKVKCV